MKRLALILLLAAFAGGWSPGSCIPEQIFQASTASISNPVTKDMLNGVENSGILIFAGLKAYKKACVDLVVLQTCRKTIQSIQVYTRKLRHPDGSGILADLRNFVKNNDQVNAVIAYNAAMQIMADIRTVAASNNVQVQ